MKYFLERLANILFMYPTDTWEFASSVQLILFGIWLNVGSIMGSSTLYRVLFLNSFAPPPRLSGLIVLFCGLLLFAGLLRSKLDTLRYIGNILSAIVWISCCYALANVETWLLSVAATGAWSALSSLAVIRLHLLRRQWRNANPGKKMTGDMLQWDGTLFEQMENDPKPQGWGEKHTGGEP